MRKPARDGMKDMIYPVKRFLGIAILLAGFCSLAMAEDQSRPLPKSLLPWKLAFVRDNNIWVAEADGGKQEPVTKLWKRGKSKNEPRYPNVGIGISWHPNNGSLTFSHPEAFKVERLDGTAGILPTQKAARGIIVGSSIFDLRLNAKRSGNVC